jgi:hypothetical protein
VQSMPIAPPRRRIKVELMGLAVADTRADMSTAVAVSSPLASGQGAPGCPQIPREGRPASDVTRAALAQLQRERSRRVRGRGSLDPSIAMPGRATRR